MKDGETKFTLVRKAEKLCGRILRADTATTKQEKKAKSFEAEKKIFVYK